MEIVAIFASITTKTQSTMKRNIYKEVTSDNGNRWICYASDNYATYILMSSHAHDLYITFRQRFERFPSSRWYNKHFNFERV